MSEPGTRGPRLAGLVLTLIGVLVFLGSFARWGSCPTTPCGGFLQAISDYSGIDLGFGVFTAIAALALIAIGIASLLRPGAWDVAWVATLASVVIIVAALASIVSMYVLPGDDKEFYWPPGSATIIAVLGLIALVTSRFLPSFRNQVSGNNPT